MLILQLFSLHFVIQKEERGQNGEQSQTVSDRNALSNIKTLIRVIQILL